MERGFMTTEIATKTDSNQAMLFYPRQDRLQSLQSLCFQPKQIERPVRNFALSVPISELTEHLQRFRSRRERMPGCVMSRWGIFSIRAVRVVPGGEKCFALEED